MASTLIIGANRGIGLALATQLHARGDDVIATCRTPSEALSGLGVRVEPGVDVTSDEAVGQLVERLGDARVSLLIHNAGLLTVESLGDMDLGRVSRQLEVNAVAPLRVVHALLPRLEDGGKVALLTSRMGSLADNSSGGAYGYRMSKAALNAAGVSLGHDLRPRGIAVALLHPGWVRTDMTSHRGNVSADESARQLIARIDELTLEGSGRFVHASGEALPW